MSELVIKTALGNGDLKMDFKMNFVENLRLDVIATFNESEQDLFNCVVTEDSLKNEKSLIKYVKDQLKNDDLVKLSLCWECPSKVVSKYPTVKESIEKNGKYLFNEWA